MNTPFLTLHNIHKSFGTKKVLDGLNFELGAGQVLGLLGRNGAGKSTMLQIALGLFLPQQGTAELFGVQADQIGSDIKQVIGYVPQTPTGFEWMKVGDMLRFVGNYYTNWNQDRVKELVGRWQLDPQASVAKLSPGQRQMLAIVQALGHDPDLLLLDEPVASLDPSMRREFLREVIDISLNERKTILLSTHITSDLERVSGEVAFLKDGQIVLRGGLDELKERVQKVHLFGAQPNRSYPKMKGILSSHIEDECATFTILDPNRKLLEQLTDQYQTNLHLEPMSLEDLFLAIHQK